MTTINLIRRASGTNEKFHVEGQMITCSVEMRNGSPMYVYETDDAQVARRLQIVHGFKVEARGVKQVEQVRKQVKKPKKQSKNKEE